MCLSSRNLSRTAQKLPYLLVFLFLFVCNVLTKYMVDDFAYLYSFQNGQRIESIFDIFPSMYAHAQYMNGRLIPHFLVQLFTLPPTWVFRLGECRYVRPPDMDNRPRSGGGGTPGKNRFCVSSPSSLCGSMSLCSAR